MALGISQTLALQLEEWSKEGPHRRECQWLVKERFEVSERRMKKVRGMLDSPIWAPEYITGVSNAF